MFLNLAAKIRVFSKVTKRFCNNNLLKCSITSKDIISCNFLRF